MKRRFFIPKRIAFHKENETTNHLSGNRPVNLLLQANLVLCTLIRNTYRRGLLVY